MPRILITILLIPAKLIIKALGYIIGEVMNAAALVIGITAALVSKIAAILGGLMIIGGIILLAFASPDSQTLVYTFGGGVAMILVPLIVKYISSELSYLSGVIIAEVQELELFPVDYTDINNIPQDQISYESQNLYYELLEKAKKEQEGYTNG